jgi:hypothetical protein
VNLIPESQWWDAREIGDAWGGGMGDYSFGFNPPGGTIPDGTGDTSGGAGGWQMYVPRINLNVASGGGGASATDPTSAAVEALNAAEAALQRNLSEYMTGPRTLSAQQTALAYFDRVWQQVRAILSDPRLGSWGANGLAERSPGGRYDWTAYYRAPIAADKPAVDAAGIAGMATSPWALLLAGGVLLIVVLRRRKQ